MRTFKILVLVLALTLLAAPVIAEASCKDPGTGRILVLRPYTH